MFFAHGLKPINLKHLSVSVLRAKFHKNIQKMHSSSCRMLSNGLVLTNQFTLNFIAPPAICPIINSLVLTN